MTRERFAARLSRQPDIVCHAKAVSDRRGRFRGAAPYLAPSQDGHEVHAVDSLRPLTGAVDPANGWPLYEPRDFATFKFYQQDCRDFFVVRSDTDFDYAFHLAAMVGGRLMIEERPLAVADDLSIDAAFWQWAARTRPKQSVCFSSSAAYPITLQRQYDYVLLREDMIDFQSELGMPDLSYGWSKLTAEYLGLGSLTRSTVSARSASDRSQAMARIRMRLTRSPASVSACSTT